MERVVSPPYVKSFIRFCSTLHATKTVQLLLPIRTLPFFRQALKEHGENRIPDTVLPRLGGLEGGNHYFRDWSTLKPLVFQEFAPQMGL